MFKIPLRIFKDSPTKLLVFGHLLLILCSSCASKVILIDSDTESEVVLLDSNALSEKGKLLGKTPREVPFSELQGQVVKLTAPSRSSQYWYFHEPTGDQTKLLVKMEDPIGNAASSNADGSGMNVPMRLILQSYKALVSNDPNAAIGFAEKAAVMIPKVAAPLVVKGLALLELGRKDEARIVFKQAKTLDPEDASIDPILERLQ